MSSLRQHQTFTLDPGFWSGHPEADRDPLPPHNGTEASVAGARAGASASADQKAKVLGLLKAREMTSAEIGDVLNIQRTTIDARLNRLRVEKKVDHVREGDGRTKRRLSRFRDGSASEVRHQVWCATLEGLNS